MVATVDPYLVEWLDLVFRWFHVIAGIVWIGTSFYFVALDSHLLPPEDERDRDRGAHSGLGSQPSPPQYPETDGREQQDGRVDKEPAITDEHESDRVPARRVDAEKSLRLLRRERG